MRKLNVRHDPLPGIGDVFEFDTASGCTVTVVAHRSGRRDLELKGSGRDRRRSAILSRSESAALASLLTGAIVDITTSPRS